MNEVNKKITKNSDISQNVHFGCFTNEMEYERGKQFSNKVIVLNATSALYFNTKMPGRRVSKNIEQLAYFNYYKGKSAKEIADTFSLKI